jgi:GNAT superfamily N-acetyltransferase
MSARISVRAATAADAEAIVPLLEEMGYPTDIETLRERLSRLRARNDCLVLVAQSDAGEICGWLQANSSEVLESGFRVEIVGLVTAKKMRRHGVGRLLVEQAEAWANRINAPAIVVRSNVNRAESHEFYTALGYANTKTQKVYRKEMTAVRSSAELNSACARIR